MRRLSITISISVAIICLIGSAYSANYVVDNLGDVDDGNTYTAGDGSNTLRKCIRLANTNSGPDTISFSISGTISPSSALPALVDNGTIIDASTQWLGPWPGGQPGITLNGSGAGNVNGLVISGASNCHIKGLFIKGFQYCGILIYGGANQNTVGGTTAGDRNVISGNDQYGGRYGVRIEGAGTDSNIVTGNYIGTDVNGTAYLGNFGGVYISGSAKSNTIGGTIAGERNIISGNNGDGVFIYGTGTDSNKVTGNYIGTDVTGTADLGNFSIGVIISDGAKSNTIGGTTTGERNIISGNDQYGIFISGTSTSDNTIAGNYIGTDVTGTADLGNSNIGVFIIDGANANTIGGTTAGERNVISGNNKHGVRIAGGYSNKVTGNYIGTDVNGTAELGNSQRGVSIDAGAKDNIIGGTTAGERNIISGNYEYGVCIEGAGTDSNIVTGNYIGTDVTGTADMGFGYQKSGVYISGSANANTIGGTTAGERNIISGNDEYGVHIKDAGTDSNKVTGNYIGTDVTGTAGLGNTSSGINISYGAKSNTIGGTTAGERNIISGNYGYGVRIEVAGTDSNKVTGNYIGTDVNGTADLGNFGGVYISGSAKGNTIGGTTAGERNIISGNYGYGVRIEGAGTDSNKVTGNYIGTDVNGTAGLGNTSSGINISYGAKSNTIGGTTAGERNIISGNYGYGVRIEVAGTDSNKVTGNYIGTDVNGTADLGNTSSGIYISDNAKSNIIGGTTESEGNAIAFNGERGVHVYGASTDFNRISHNSIHDNERLGIDLEAGGNDEIPAPIAECGLAGNTLTVTGSGAGANASVEVFKADSAASREGKAYLGILTADVSGVFSGTIDVTGEGVSAGDPIVATTTHTTSNTSEFGLVIWAPYVVSITRADPSPTRATSVKFTVTFSENVFGVDPSDFILTKTGTANGIVSSVSSSSVATVTVSSVTGDGTLRLDLIDNDSIKDDVNNPLGGAGAGNGNFTTGQVYTIDHTPPTVSIGPPPSATNTGPVTYAVTYSGADAINLMDGSITLNKTGTANGSVSVSNGTTANPTVTISDITGNGTLGISIAPGTSSDAVGNTDAGAGPSGTFSVDNTPPIVISITRADPSPTKATSIRFTVTFSENVSGSDTGDFALAKTGTANGTIASVSASTVATVTVGSVTGDGTLRLDLIDDDSIKDDVNNPLGGAGAGNGNFTTGETYVIFQSQILIVDNPGDVDNSLPYVPADGTNTLRKCIRLANTTAGGNTVNFSILGTISPASALPELTDNGTIIDASSRWSGARPGGGPGVTLDGSAAPADTYGLSIRASNCQIRGLFIRSFKGSGVCIYNGAKGNIIGGTLTGERNIISGNNQNGVVITDSGTNNNRVTGNYIGTDITGAVDLGNLQDGVVIGDGAQSNTIGGTTIDERNIISGNDFSGVAIKGTGADNNKICGNYIGTGVTGAVGLGNQYNGVYLGSGARSNTIERNIISGNAENGIHIKHSGTSNNGISGNYIGTDITGTADLGNSQNGIRIAEGAQSNIIAENIIAFNQHEGVKVENAATDYNTITRNSMRDNAGTGIDLVDGGNDEIPAPSITYNVLDNSVLNISGTGAGVNATVEIFEADSPTSEGMTYLGTLIANTTGGFSGSMNVAGKGLSVGDPLVATTTHTDNNTSEFSITVIVQLLTTYQYGMEEGWNLISFSVNKCFYEGNPPTDQPACVKLVNIADLEFNTLADWFSSVITPNNAWEMVIGPNGAIDSSLPAIFHTLKYMSVASGYWVKIKEGAGSAKLSLEGQLFDPTCRIPLLGGWNSIGCPLGVGYYDNDSPPGVSGVTNWVKVDPPVAAYVFRSIAGKFTMIIAEYGAYDPALPAIFNSLHYIVFGAGYWIKMIEAADLTYSP